MEDRFYSDTIGHLTAKGNLLPGDEILVVCGGPLDAEVLRSAGLSKVTISNLDERLKGDEFAPFRWSFQDAEHLTFEDNSFDWVIVHNGLHHCLCPPAAILEMYRVARKGILLFEPYDNVLTRVGVELGFGQSYEHAAVYYNDSKYGGVRNSAIPNYVYRITRREVRKILWCGMPHLRPEFRFFHKMRIPWGQLKGRRNRMFYVTTRLAEPLLNAFSWVVPTQSNCFAAMVIKPAVPAGLQPWLSLNQDGKIVPNQDWMEARYKPV